MQKKQRNLIENDFSLNKENKCIELKFLSNISKSKIFISSETGLIFHKNNRDSLSIVNEWSKKIYSNKMDPKKGLYSDDFPGMSSRHFFVLDFLSRELNMQKKNIIDFACGQGGLLLKARQHFNCKNLTGVEHSSENIKIIKSRFRKNKVTQPQLYSSSIERFKSRKKFDIGFLTWTLCNCAEPLDIIKSISSLIKKNGILVVAESSRILVPFKKPIFNYFNAKKDIGHIHPWHWTLNSLSNIFKLFGFEILRTNRYFDEDNLVIVFKNSQNFSQKFNFDNPKKIIDFLKRWKAESMRFKEFDV